MTRDEMIDTLRDVARNVGDIDRAKIEAVIAKLEEEQKAIAALDKVIADQERADAALDARDRRELT